MQYYNNEHSPKQSLSMFAKLNSRVVNGATHTEFINLGTTVPQELSQAPLPQSGDNTAVLVAENQIVPPNAEKISVQDVRSGDSIFIKRNQGFTRIESFEFTLNNDPLVNGVATLLDGQTLDLYDYAQSDDVEVYRLSESDTEVVESDDIQEIHDLIDLLTSSESYSSISKGDLVTASWITDEVSFTTEGIAYKKTPTGWETKQGYVLALDSPDIEYMILEERALLSHQVWRKQLPEEVVPGDFVAVRSFSMDVVLTRMAVVDTVTNKGLFSLSGDQIYSVTDPVSECYVFITP